MIGLRTALAVFVCALSAVALASPPSSSPAGASKEPLQVLFTGDVGGKIGPCG